MFVKLTIYSLRGYFHVSMWCKFSFLFITDLVILESSHNDGSVSPDIRMTRRVNGFVLISSGRPSNYIPSNSSIGGSDAIGRTSAKQVLK